LLTRPIQAGLASIRALSGRLQRFDARRSPYPEGTTQQDSLLVLAVATAALTLTRVSPYGLTTRALGTDVVERYRAVLVELWVLLWLAILVSIESTGPIWQGSEAAAFIFSLVAAVRAVEIVSY
jgi:hypothetical protein